MIHLLTRVIMEKIKKDCEILNEAKSGLVNTQPPNLVLPLISSATDPLGSSHNLLMLHCPSLPACSL